MKKSSIIIIAVAVLIAALAGAFYIGRLNSKEKTAAVEPGKTLDTQPESQDGDITFYEKTYVISESETINAKCLKTAQNASIYALYPVSDKNRYDISSSGYMALYLSNDGSIWLLYSDGSKKKLTPDKYGSIDKNEMLKKNSKYIWAYEPQFTMRNSVRFVTNLPDTGDSPKKSIWEISLDNGDMKEIYTPVSDSYSPLGDREDGKYLVLDGSSISVVDTSTCTAQSINVEDKHIISLSPDGTRIVYTSGASDGKVDYEGLKVMDSFGNNVRDIPKVAGYTATDLGSWYSDGTKYAFIVKSVINGGGDGIAVASFSEDNISINVYSPGEKTIFPENSKLSWIQDNAICVDMGDNIINVDLAQ